MKEVFKEKTNNLKRVLVVGMYDKIGGVETFLMNYYRNIDKNVIQMDFVSKFDKICFEDEIRKNGGKIYKIDSEKKHPIKHFKEMKRIIKDNHYDIVHINMRSVANPLPILAANACKVKHIIVHSHNSNTPAGIIRKLMDKINRPFLNLATDYWACSKLAGKWMFGRKRDFKVINNAVVLEKYSLNMDVREKIRQELNVSDKLLIGHIGRFSYQKNHDFLINVFFELQKNMTNVQLLLIGEGELSDPIKNKAKKLGISDKIIFLGTTNKIEEYLQAMDLFVLPSRFEGLPVVGIEAQASGTYCLFSNNITKELDLTNNNIFLKLDVRLWKEKMMNTEIYTKRSISNSLLEKEYNIINEAKKMEELFLTM